MLTETYAFDGRLGKRPVFILDPRLVWAELFEDRLALTQG